MSEDVASVLAEVGDFQKDKLKHVDPTVKNVLPTADDVKHEKNETQLMHDIEQGTHLKKVTTVEKNSLPTKEDIEREKKEQK
ncbi:Thymosin beta 4 [Echinococcus multilocularis]|uniref:Thymosin beta 4 n=1 Tax=Echinococcus multilocularis TaxID=6211 RepID=A0A087W1P4_ECHMU|nr:Thymosin beta 4 [Echinococcus multilocularis]